MGFQKGNKLSKNGGRPKAPHTLLSEKMKAKYVERASKMADELFDAQVDLALGHFTEQDSESGSIKVYKKSPDGSAIKDILDRSQGKAKEVLEADIRGTLSLVELLRRAKEEKDD